MTSLVTSVSVAVNEYSTPAESIHILEHEVQNDLEMASLSPLFSFDRRSPIRINLADQ